MKTFFKYENSFLNSRIFSGRPIWENLFNEWIYLYPRYLQIFLNKKIYFKFYRL